MSDIRPVVCARCNVGHATEGLLCDACRAGMSSSSLAGIGRTAVADFIGQHSVTCDCCQHVMIDVTAACVGGEQHCVAGLPGDGGHGCAHSWHQTVKDLEEEGDERQARIESLETTVAACVQAAIERDQLRARVAEMAAELVVQRSAVAQCREYTEKLKAELDAALGRS